MPLRFAALPAADVARIRDGHADGNGQQAERHISDGGGNPCRHCLRDIPAGAPMLILAWRPFPSLNPYSETGPIFLCAACDRHADGPALPPIVASRRNFLIRGYTADHRIAHGTGQIAATATLADACASLLGGERIAYVHLRSARGMSRSMLKLER